ncbi:MAG: hypothetical protein GXY61_11115 [Lentisphaerae bacterium]|jgi:hypothetical protein|nr:hypothetical protein [Lentisphaerota bacterium]
MKHIISLFILLTLSGCVGYTGGNISGRKSGYTVWKQLHTGMTLEETQLTLADGGALFPPEIYIRNADGGFTPADPDQNGNIEYLTYEMETLPKSEHARIQKVVIQSRGWGFFGFDKFYLFFDEEDKLLNHTVLHYN